MMRLLPFLFLTCTFAVVGAEPAGTAPKAPMPPASASPVDLFRKLLTTNHLGREMWLASKPASTRQYVESKLREYELLSGPQRDARLHALQLRWYLRSFMRMSPVERAPRLAALPEPDRTLLRQQLGPWDILPPQLKKEVLENENLIQMIVTPGGTNRTDQVFAAMTPEQREELQRQNERWNQLPGERRSQILDRFNQFFELRDAEKSRVVAQLTDSEREQMEKTLSRFSQLSREEREQAMQGFKKFAELSPSEQALFLRTADRWKTMNETDKQLWRRVVAGMQTKRVAPTPSLPQPPPERPKLTATN